jgi:hypothetical protein
MMIMRYLSSLTMLLALVVGPSVRAADKAPSAKKITYDEHVLPILKQHCTACHGQDKAKSGLRMHTYTNLMMGGSSGVVVKGGDPGSSTLFRVVSHQEQPFMPPESPMLSKDKLEILRAWIAGGALENSGSKPTVAPRPKTEIGLTSIVKGRPSGPPPMPEVKLSLDPIVKTAKASALTALACSPWAPLAAVAGQKQVLLYNTDSLDLIGVLPFPEGIPHVLRFSRNGSLLLAGGGHAAKSGKIVVWNVKTCKRILTVGDEGDAVLAADISADQTQIALGGPSKMIRVYSTQDGTLIREIKKHTDWVTALEYSPDGVLLATGDRNGGLFVWEAFTGREYFSLRAHTAAIAQLSWRGDSNVLASTSEDTTLRLWEMENGNQIKAWGAHGGGVQSVHFAHDNRIASCGRDRVARVWDMNGAQQRVFDAFSDVALRVAFTHDDARVIAGDWTGQVRVWNGKDGKLVGVLDTNPKPVADLLAGATKELAEREAAYKPLAAAAAASQTAAQKASQDLVSAQQAATDTAAAAQIVNEAVARAKGPADKANADLAGMQTQVQAKDLLAKSLAEAAAKVKAAADKDKINKELAAAAAKAQTIAGQAAAELAAAQKNAAAVAAMARTANERLAQTQRAAATTNATAATAAKALAERTPPVRTLVAKAAADKAAAEQAAAALTAAKARVDRLRTSSVVAKGPEKK